MPEFVDGVVDVAQRGRSLGVHLVLATQRPGGVVNDNIRANTNLRIALRVADENDSSDVIDGRTRRAFPKSLPGRGYLRTGHDEVREIRGPRSEVPPPGAQRAAARCASSTSTSRPASSADAPPSRR